MPNRVRAERARQHFAEIIATAEKGGVTIIEKYGKPKAMVVPMTSEPSGPPTKVKLTTLAGTGAGLWGKSPARFIDKLRAEW